MEPLFSTQNLHFGGFLCYGDMMIPSRKITFITGESGCGKTTFLKLLTGILSPEKGSVFYRAQDISERNSLAHRRDVSLVSQDIFLFDLSIRQNFSAFYQYRGMSPPGDFEIKKFLSVCCLDFSLEKQVQTMSGGEKQRLYIALFLSFLPSVLLLDEPTSALDEKTGLALIRAIILFCKNQGTELLIVSHNKNITASLTENTIHINGRCKA